MIIDDYFKPDKTPEWRERVHRWYKEHGHLLRGGERMGAEIMAMGPEEVDEETGTDAEDDDDVEDEDDEDEDEDED
jgi:hypothetical protein